MENHPYHPNDALREYISQYGIVIEAWYPLGHGDASLRNEPVFARLAEKYGKSPVQVILRWHVQKGNSIIPGSKSPAHLADNLDIFDFALTDDEMAEIAELATPGKTYYTADESVYERYLSIPDDFDVQEAKYQEELKAEILAASDEYWRAQFDLDVDQLRRVCDASAPFVHMGITMDRRAEEEAIAQRHIVTVKRDDKYVDVRVIDDEIAIVLRQLELVALVGGNEAVNPFVATETYHRQADGSWKLISFVYTHIIPDNYQFRFLSK